MPLVQAKCTNCGANLEVNSEHDAAVCPYCHTAFVVEKAISNYVTNNVTNIDQLHADVVNINDSKSADNLAKSGDTFIILRDYDAAIERFKSIKENYPYDYRGWWGLVRAETRDFTRTVDKRAELSRINSYAQNAVRMSTEPEKLKEQFSPFYDKMLKIIEEIEATERRIQDEKKEAQEKAQAERDRLRSELESQKNSFDARIKQLFYDRNHTKPLTWLFVLIVLAATVFIVGSFIHDGESFGLILSALIFCVFNGIIVIAIANAICEKKCDAKIHNLDREISSCEKAREEAIRSYSERISECSEIINKNR